MTRKTITAVHEQDLERFLERLGMLDGFRRGEIKCSVCKKTITSSNLGCVYPKGEEIRFCCSNLKCYGTVVAP